MDEYEQYDEFSDDDGLLPDEEEAILDVYEISDTPIDWNEDLGGTDAHL